jgi:hypothetical protein
MTDPVEMGYKDIVWRQAAFSGVYYTRCGA